jgi:hypothetical protein
MTTDLPDSKPGGAKRTGGLLLLAGAVALLFAGVFGFERARHALPEAKSNLVRAEAALNDAHMREQLAVRNRALLSAANDLQTRAQNLGIVPQSWGERQINMRQQHLAREDINQLLMTTVRGKGQILQPEEFELSVTSSDEGLFDAPGATPQTVQLTLRGAVHFRISERAL